MKLKVGDKVKIIGNSHGSCLSIGDKCIIIGFDESDNTYNCKPLSGSNSISQWHSEKDLQKIKPKNNMKLSKKQKEFIIEAYHSNDVRSGWKTKIKDNFPKLFESKLEVGKWYVGNLTSTTTYLVYFNGKFGDFVTYGFDSNGEWSDTCGFQENIKYRLATEEEVEEALIKEAEKRGFKKGVRYYDVNKKNRVINCDCGIFLYDHDINYMSFMGGGIYDNGKWSEIIPTLTRKEAEEKLGVTIVD